MVTPGIAGVLTIDLSSDDIVAAHRLGRPKNSRSPARVIVKFLNRKCVEWCLSHRSDVKYVKKEMNVNLRFYDSLCAKNEETLKMAEWLSAEGLIHRYFMRNGFVKIVVDEGDKPYKLKHPQSLRDKFEYIPDFLFYSR